jgi:hypothetical protein
MTTILHGQLIALFAFDIGYEVSLERLASLFSVAPIQPLSRKRQTPTHMQYTKSPLVLDLPTGPECELHSSSCRLQATIYDFGAVSMAYRWALPLDDSALTFENLAQLSSEIYRRNLEIQARNGVAQLVEIIAAAIDRPMLSELTEDYYLFVIDDLDPPRRAEELFNLHRKDLAQALSFETDEVSRWQEEETLNQTISYSETDLAIVDWNAAIICDRDYADTVRVLELLNVELLEARYVDAMLDKQIAAYARLVRKRAFPIPLRTPYKRTLEELTEWRIESTVLSERVGNSLKLIGDLYLSRIHTAAAGKVHLPEWERIISHKLQILDEFYERLDDRIRTAQSQALEVAIVVLIIVELVLALLRH